MLTAVLPIVGSVRPSVCPSSVTFRCFVKMNEATIMRFSPTGRTIILVSGEVKIVWKFAGDRPYSERVKMRRSIFANEN